MTSFDISLVLTLHAEGKYLPRTLRSLAEAAAYARTCGFTTELVAVLDRADAATRAIIRAYRDASFGAIEMIEVDHGSLGLARNSGCEIARGAYLSPCDGDDLISFNTLADMRAAAADEADAKAILVPQYLVAFGEEYHVAEFRGSAEVTPLSFIDVHPFTSRVFFHHSLFAELRYADLPVTLAHAYEDWHFNADALAAGYRFLPVPDTVLFYRKKKGSLLAQADATSARQIPPSRLFEPQVYLDACREAFEARAAGKPGPLPPPRNPKSDPVFAFLLSEANRSEPEIDPDLTFASRFFSNTERTDLAIGMAYYRVCETLARRRFTDVILFLGHERAPARAQFMLALAECFGSAGREVLVLTEGGEGVWPELSASRGHVIDLLQAGADLSEYGRDLIALKLVQWCGPAARVHVFQANENHRFVERFGRVLSAERLFYYVFERKGYERDGLSFIERDPSHFISENLDRFRALVSPDAALIADEQARLGVQPSKWHHVVLDAERGAAIFARLADLFEATGGAP